MSKGPGDHSAQMHNIDEYWGNVASRESKGQYKGNIFGNSGKCRVGMRES